MRQLLTAFMVAGALFVGASSQTKAIVLGPIVADGDFTNPSGGGGFLTYGPGPMGPWTVTGDSVDLIGGYWQGPPSGGGSVDLDGNAPGGIKQTINIPTAGQYLLSFYLSGNPDGGSLLKTVAVSVGNQSNIPFTFITGGNSHGSMNYILETLLFDPPGPTTLSFTSLDEGSSPFGPVIGGVTVSATPLPAAVVLFGSILAGGGLLLRRRRSGAATAAA
jgi:choice-of-anchor C domain-containing protein